MEVLVFKTDVWEEAVVNEVSALLTTLPGIRNWNFDLEDCDRILRVVAADVHAEAVERLLQGAGIGCLELGD